jgi:hypothetical protein
MLFAKFPSFLVIGLLAWLSFSKADPGAVEFTERSGISTINEAANNHAIGKSAVVGTQAVSTPESRPAVQNNNIAQPRIKKCGVKAPKQASGRTLAPRPQKMVQAETMRTGRAAESLYTFNLKTCIGIAAVSGDRTQKATAHIKAWDIATGQDYRTQLASIIAEARWFDNPEITISNPDPGAGGDKTSA